MKLVLESTKETKSFKKTSKMQDLDRSSKQVVISVLLLEEIVLVRIGEILFLLLSMILLNLTFLIK